MRKPLVIYVSGAPGSGKTTLAEMISQELYIPHVSSDLVHGGVRLTEGKPNDRKWSMHNAFIPLLIETSKRHVSYVVDHVLQQNMSEHDIVAKLLPHAQIVYIHTYCHEPIARHLQRELARRDKGVVLDEVQLVARAEFHRQNLINTAEGLRLDIPTLKVDTNDGYKPTFTEVISFIENSYQREE